ncbi:MAG: hypothetical protein QOK15_1377 [Nocardioidaceae bacterium]|nr:hypothetical protein [Nocardioidaceae bacterium]
MSPDFPNKNENPDTEDTTVPPYDGRRESADIDGPEKATKDGARTGGATGPVESPDGGSAQDSKGVQDDEGA